jgi:hypothetical protein
VRAAIFLAQALSQSHRLRRPVGRRAFDLGMADESSVAASPDEVRLLVNEADAASIEINHPNSTPLVDAPLAVDNRPMVETENVAGQRLTSF